MGVAGQGKWAEGKVRDWLNQYKAARASFTFNRILDAHSARGAMANPQPGDFQWFMDTGWMIMEGVGLVSGPDGGPPDGPLHYTRNGLIEVKSVEHAFRLPYKNFSIDQIGRLRLRQMAGSETMVIVAFKPKTEKQVYWRTAPLEFFEQQTGRGSWDMSDIDAYSHCSDLLEMMLK